jgi:hypothetical protein
MCNQSQNRNLLQLDYVLPFGKSSQFGAGYHGDFAVLTDYRVDNDGVEVNNNFTNKLGYKEKVNALYTIWCQSK